LRLINNITLRESVQTSIWSFITREPGKANKEKKQMTAVTTHAGAVSHDMKWHSIDWWKAHQIVNRLQARIVKAIQANRWGKVKTLQRLLTHSFSGKALSVKRVTENQGKNTPGVDQQIWNTPEKKAAAIYALRQYGYKPSPLRRVYIPKSNDKMRPLSIPVMKDRGMQALYLLALDPIAETNGDKNSYGFRKERSAADAIAECFLLFRQKTSAQWVLEGDIKSCFDEISHSWLENNIPMDKSILKKWLKAGFIDKHSFYPTEAGTPQGGIASPTLANLALNGLEDILKKRFSNTFRRNLQNKVHLVRYCDDFIITAVSKQILEQEVKPLVEEFLHHRGLRLSQEKTKITHIERGFDFLGQNVRKYNGKLLIKPSAKSIKMFLEKIRGVIKINKPATAGQLVLKLNPIIKGWANYHCHVVSKKIFNRVDCAIFKSLWQWARRRHPKKSLHWIGRKYFHPSNENKWVFFGQIADKEGDFYEIKLFKASSTPICRHVKIKGEANPYDPAWESYFEKRLGIKMVNRLKGKRKLIHLWKEQKGICPICNQKITVISGWHCHHLIQRVYGGSNNIDNLVLLHPNCHNLVHSQKISVVKLRLTKDV